ncbi:Rv3235 family protein [Saccharopolyspora griseoalba]|uniref:Rv3235 family protein n=1 Tax=Saccharopolyspora griseoalba TaxID=1431848 RepID=A0ABW2LI68_9PSEU
MTLSLTDPVPTAEMGEPESSSAAAVAAFLGRCVFGVLSGRIPPEAVRGHLTGQALSSLLAIRLREARSPDCRLRSVHACPITRSRVEACVLVGAHRVRALVLRAEWTAGRWSCTRLSLV